MSYKDQLVKLNLLPLEYRTDPALTFKAKGDHVDLNHQDIFRQTEIHHRRHNACKFNYHIPYTKQNCLKHYFLLHGV